MNDGYTARPRMTAASGAATYVVDDVGRECCLGWTHPNTLVDYGRMTLWLDHRGDTLGQDTVHRLATDFHYRARMRAELVELKCYTRRGPKK